MQVYKVSPIIKYSPFFSLTYISKEDFAKGDVVMVDFNKREVGAVVLEKYDLKDAKVELRKADFQTKKILHKQENAKFSPFFCEKLIKFCDEKIYSVGEVYNCLLNAKKYTPHDKIIYFPDDLNLKISKSKSENFLTLKGYDIFENLDDKVLEIEIRNFNFDKYVDFQSPHISKLDLLFWYLENIKKTKTKLILTGQYFGVVEKFFLENFKSEKIEIELKTVENKSKKFLANVGFDKNGEEEIVSVEVLEKISGKIFMFVLSHGYANTISCKDCKSSYNCEKCEQHFSLVKDEEGQYLFCKNCKNKKILKPDQYVICRKCGSWRVFPFGIGIQKTYEYLQEKNFSTMSIDESEKRLTPKKILEKVKNFLESDTQILVGSIRTLHVLQEILQTNLTTVLVSTGPIIKGNNFDSDENLIKIISDLESISNILYINKRPGDEISLENYKDVEKFYEQEIKNRKVLFLPPFSKIISLVFNIKNKRFVDKFLKEDITKFAPINENRKGMIFTYSWSLDMGEKKNQIFVKNLRQFGDVAIVNSANFKGLIRK